MNKFDQCVKNLELSSNSIGHQRTGDWFSRFFEMPSMIIFFDLQNLKVKKFFSFTIYFITSIQCSEARKAKESLIAKGYRVDYANDKRKLNFRNGRRLRIENIEHSENDQTVRSKILNLCNRFGPVIEFDRSREKRELVYMLFQNVK